MISKIELIEDLKFAIINNDIKVLESFENISLEQLEELETEINTNGINLTEDEIIHLEETLDTSNKKLMKEQISRLKESNILLARQLEEAIRFCKLNNRESDAISLEKRLESIMKQNKKLDELTTSFSLFKFLDNFFSWFINVIILWVTSRKFVAGLVIAGVGAAAVATFALSPAAPGFFAKTFPFLSSHLSAIGPWLKASFSGASSSLAYSMASHMTAFKIAAVPIGVAITGMGMYKILESFVDAIYAANEKAKKMVENVYKTEVDKQEAELSLGRFALSMKSLDNNTRNLFNNIGRQQNNLNQYNGGYNNYSVNNFNNGYTNQHQNGYSNQHFRY